MHHDLEPLPRWGFAFPRPIRDELTALALAGTKTATAGLVVEMELDGGPVPVDGDCAQMAALLNASFGRTVHTAAEYRTFVTRSPSFRHDLNLVALAADGSLAPHAGFTLDEANRHGIIEPVRTHSDHRQLGLGRALILEGLGRLRDLGAVTCNVETGDMVPANALYRSIGFTEEYRGHQWRRELGNVA